MGCLAYHASHSIVKAAMLCMHGMLENLCRPPEMRAEVRICTDMVACSVLAKLASKAGTYPYPYGAPSLSTFHVTCELI